MLCVAIHAIGPSRPISRVRRRPLRQRLPVGIRHRREHRELQCAARGGGGFATDQAIGEFGDPRRYFAHAVPGAIVVSPPAELLGELRAAGTGRVQLVAELAGNGAAQCRDRFPIVRRERAASRVHAQNSDNGERREPPRLRSLRRRRRMRECSSRRRLRSHSSRVTGSSFFLPRRTSSRTRNSQKS